MAIPSTPTESYVTDGSVETIAKSGNDLYLGGQFGVVGPRTGSFAEIDSSTGAPDPAYPEVTGTVNAAVSDGSGGWYIGGSFTHIGGVARANLAHIKSDKTLDTAWTATTNSTVDNLILSGGVLYVSGSFTTIGPTFGTQGRARLAALTASTGSVTSWDPSPNSSINAMALSGSTLYVGGAFTTIGANAASRRSIAAIETSTGNATAWNPNPNSSSTVIDVDVSGSTVYATGNFTTIGGQPRNRIAGLDTGGTGLATAFNPNSDGQVNAVTANGSTVYAAGFFDNIGGQARNGLAALNASNGTATSWDPNPNFSFPEAITVSGSTVYVGGGFTSIGGQPRPRLAALDATTGNATTWSPNATGSVNTITVSGDGSKVYAGGSFTSVGGEARNRIASLNATTGALNSWNPNADGTVRAIAVDGSTVYAGGSFTSIGGQTRNRIAAIDANGNATSWNPNAGGNVEAIKVSGSTVYAGGFFTTIGGETRNKIAALNATSGNATAWNPDGGTGSVRTIDVSGSTVYAGGDFTTMGGQPRDNIAAIDAGTGSATTWNPDASSSVVTLEVAGSLVYVAGGFSTIGGQPRNDLAALETSTGNATGWNPGNVNGFINEMDVFGSEVYIVGEVFGVGASPSRTQAAAIDTATGAVTDFAPSFSSITSSVLATGNSVYIGGGFNRVGTAPQQGIAFFNKHAASLSTTATSGNAGQPISDTATLSGGVDATGTLTFRVFGPNDANCIGTAAYTSIEDVNGNGAYGSGNFTPPGAGTYRWTVDYSGDFENAAASSPCNAANETSTVSKLTPALSTTATATATAGQAISDTGTLSGAYSPGGTITFRAYGPNDANCTGTAAYSNTVNVNANGAYNSGDFTPNRAGTFRWTANYSGDANNNTASSACNAANETSTVAKASPSLANSATSGTAGQAISDTVTLTAGQGPSGPTGTITFRAYSPGDTTCSGPTAYSNPVNLNTGNGNYGSGNFVPSTAGTYRWTASYSGDDDNNSVTTACNAANSTSTVAKATPTLATSATSITIGGPISDVAALFGGQGPTGTIEFKVYGPDDATCTNAPADTMTINVSSGNGVYGSGTFTPATAGAYRWTADYSGDANNNAVSSACNAANETSTVSKVNPSLDLDATGAVIDDPIGATATLSGGYSPTGTITFDVFGPGDSDCSDPPVHSIAVNVHAGNGDYDSAGFTPNATGAYYWTASYSGNTNNESESTSCNAAGSVSTVTPKTIPGLAMTAAQDGTAGGSISSSAALTGGDSPTGTITFRAYGPDDGDCSETPALQATRNVDSGNTTYSSGNLAVNLAGDYSWTASYSGDDDNDNVSTACAAANSTSAVAKAGPSVSASGGPGATLGQPITASSDLASGVSPTGTITFRAYGPADATCANAPAVGATVNVNAGNGSYASGDLTPDSAGAYRWRAFYSGDANNLAATSTCNAAGTTTNLAKASPNVANDATSGPVGTAITDTATLSGGLGPAGPTGNLTFRAYGPGDATCANSPAFSATVPVNSGNDDYGSGNFTANAAGTYRWRIEYSGDADNEATTSGCNAADSTSTVAKSAPTLTTATANATVGEPIADTATLAGGHSPTGTITFRVYGPGNANCTGAATQTLTADVDSGNDDYGSGNLTTTQAGVYRWTAEYSGDANNDPASSPCNAPGETSTVAKETPALTTTASNGVHGGTISDTATLAGGHAPAGTITFRAYGPGDATCGDPAAYENTVSVNAGNGNYGSGNFAPPAPGDYRWTADYSGDANNDAASSACNALDETSTVAAPLTVAKAGTGQGGVAADAGSIDCGPDCSHDYTAGATVTLTATPDANSDFDGFSANCTPVPAEPEECTVTMDAAKAVTATFISKQRRLDVTRSGPGDGSVSSAPGGINCGADCSGDYQHNAVVTLTANAVANSDFDGWSANCAPAPGEPEECTVTMDAAETVTARFRLKQRRLDVIAFGTGSGGVTSAPGGIDCGTDCTEEYADGTMVTVTATPAVGSELAGFSGQCEVDPDQPNQCRTTMSAARTVAVAFVEAVREEPGPTDTTAPDTAITAKPDGSGKRSSRFRYASSEPEGATFACRIDQDGWEECGAGGVNYRNLAPGTHRFKVYAIDFAGNADETPATAKFKVRRSSGGR